MIEFWPVLVDMSQLAWQRFGNDWTQGILLDAAHLPCGLRSVFVSRNFFIFPVSLFSGRHAQNAPLFINVL